MASFIGALESYNPYVQQIPTDAYVKVGMFKEQEYQAGVKRVQDTIDNIAGLDIATEGGRQYLRARVDELTKSLNKYSAIDFSNVNNVTQLVGLAKPLYQDENIVTDVINTGVYRKWAKDAGEALKNNRMQMGQYVREMTDANVWLNSKSAGAAYTGRQAPNTATKKDLTDRIIKAKKDALDQNVFVKNTNYDPESPYYNTNTHKWYSEEEFNNFVSEAIMSSNDREMLMNDHWYENQGTSPEQLQLDVLSLYNNKLSKVDKEIEKNTALAKVASEDNKDELEAKVKELEAYKKSLNGDNGIIKDIQGRNLADPRDVDFFHRILAESRYMTSLGVLLDEEVKDELTKNEAWFTRFNATVKAADDAAKASSGSKTGKTKTPGEVLNEVGVITPVPAGGEPTEVTSETIQTGWQNANTKINGIMDELYKYMDGVGIDVKKYFKLDASGNPILEISQDAGNAGATVYTRQFKDEASKNSFYSLVAGLNFAYDKEGTQADTDKTAFTKWVANQYPQYQDNNPNSRFSFTDRAVSDALNSMKGQTALLPKLESLFADKSVLQLMGNLDKAIKEKGKYANMYRQALITSQAFTGDEIATLKSLSDDELLSSNYQIDYDRDAKKYSGKVVNYRVGGLGGKYGYAEPDPDGTYTIYRDIFNKEDGVDYSKPYESEKVISGIKNYTKALRDINSGGILGDKKILDKDHFKKANERIKQAYSYVQENMNFTIGDLKENNKEDYETVKDAMTSYLIQSKDILNGKDPDFRILGGNVKNLSELGGFKVANIVTGSINNSQDIFNPNPILTVQVEANDSEGKKVTFDANLSVKSFLAANPNYKNSKWGEYFAPMLYAKEEAFAQLQSRINPLEGKLGYRPSGDKTQEPAYQITNDKNSKEFQFGNVGAYSTGKDWITVPVTRGDKTTLISYQVVGFGSSAGVKESEKGPDGKPLANFQNGQFYIKFRIPSSKGGEPVVGYFKTDAGNAKGFNSASLAHYFIEDLVINNPMIDIDELNPKDNSINYFTTNPLTFRGIFNKQLSLNGYGKISVERLKDAVGKEIEKASAKEVQARF